MRAPAAFRKRPVVIEAMRYTPPSTLISGVSGNVGDISDWADGGSCAVVQPTQYWGNEGHPQCWDLYVKTLEDGDKDGVQVEHVASPGDWIVKGVAGEFYPVKPGIFAQTYEPVTS